MWGSGEGREQEFSFHLPAKMVGLHEKCLGGGKMWRVSANKCYFDAK